MRDAGEDTYPQGFIGAISSVDGQFSTCMHRDAISKRSDSSLVRLQDMSAEDVEEGSENSN